MIDAISNIVVLGTGLTIFGFLAILAFLAARGAVRYAQRPDERSAILRDGVMLLRAVWCLVLMVLILAALAALGVGMFAIFTLPVSITHEQAQTALLIGIALMVYELLRSRGKR